VRQCTCVAADMNLIRGTDFQVTMPIHRLTMGDNLLQENMAVSRASAHDLQTGQSEIGTYSMSAFLRLNGPIGILRKPSNPRPKLV
jgi:hypothetical protein